MMLSRMRRTITSVFRFSNMWAGSRRRYVPDFLVRLSSSKMLALEIKGEDSPQNKAKRDA